MGTHLFELRVGVTAVVDVAREVAVVGCVDAEAVRELKHVAVADLRAQGQLVLHLVRCEQLSEVFADECASISVGDEIRLQKRSLTPQCAAPR